MSKETHRVRDRESVIQQISCRIPRPRATPSGPCPRLSVLHTYRWRCTCWAPTCCTRCSFASPSPSIRPDGLALAAQVLHAQLAQRQQIHTECEHHHASFFRGLLRSKRREVIAENPLGRVPFGRAGTWRSPPRRQVVHSAL